jgi:hypothetical protein
VALSGDGETLIVGAPSNYRDSDAYGRVRVLRYDSVAGWMQLGADFYGDNLYDYLVSGCITARSVFVSCCVAELGSIGVDIGRRQYGGDGRVGQRRQWRQSRSGARVPLDWRRMA